MATATKRDKKESEKWRHLSRRMKEKKDREDKKRPGPKRPKREEEEKPGSALAEARAWVNRLLKNGTRTRIVSEVAEPAAS